MKKTLIGLFAVLLFASITGCGNHASGVGGNNGSGGGGTYIGSKAPSEAKAVGDIVFNDGSATPYNRDLTLTDAQKAAAIAVIFYRGRDLNNGEDTTTVRTLGVGFKKSGVIEWCKYEGDEGLANANAWNADITSIKCAVNGNIENHSFTGDKYGKDNLTQIGAFLTANGATDDTGTAAKYSAFYFAKNYKDQVIGRETGSRIISGSEYENGWYLPSIAELSYISCNNDCDLNYYDINQISSLCGGDVLFVFLNDTYWSSTQSEDDAQEAYALDCIECRLNSYYKFDNPVNLDAYACAIREF